MTSAPADRRAQKGLGAFYSPQALVEPLIAWAVTAPSHSVLDPSCGDGVFIEAAARRLRGLGASGASVARLLHAFDVNPQAAAVTIRALCPVIGNHAADIRAKSFFVLDPPGPGSAGPLVDVIATNPPYIRYQDFSGSSRTLALSRAADAGVKLTSLASSWAHFVVHAIAFLKPGGRLALILPAELIHAAYAAPLRRHLRESFKEVFVISFRSAVFPGAQEEVVLLLAAGKGERHSRLGLVAADSARDLHRLDDLLEQAESFPQGVEPTKWVSGHATSPGARSLDRLQRSGHYVVLREIGKVNIGFVSGANGFFVLSPEEARSLSLPEGSLRPALIRARQIPGTQITCADVTAMCDDNQRCLLWMPGPSVTDAEQAYIRRGEDGGISGRYKCRVRSPWWVVPGVIVPDAFLTYMSDRVPRLCLNRAGAVAANTLLTVRLPGVPEALREAWVTAFYNSATLLSCELIGRSYGGGVLKLEPGEADRILLPSLRIVSQHEQELSGLSRRLHEGLAGGPDGLDQQIASVDSIVLQACGLGNAEIDQLATARAQLAGRRRKRAKKRDRGGA